MMWGYFNICLPLWEFNIGVSILMHPVFVEDIYLLMIHYSFTKQIGVLKGWIFPIYFNEGVNTNSQKIFIPLSSEL